MAGLLNPFQEDIEAINVFIMNTRVQTPEAERIKNDWVPFFDNLNALFGPFYDQAAFDEARNRRNAFNRANAVTPQQAEQVEDVITTGVSSEQARGEPDRRQSSGDFAVAEPTTTPVDLIKVAIGAGVVLAVLYGLTQATLLTKAIKGK